MRFFSWVYILLLLYTIAALLFWGFSLQKQSKKIYGVERAALAREVDSVRDYPLYSERLSALNKRLDSRTKQYIGEGSTLLFILLLGAAVVFTSLQRKARLQRQQNNFMLAVTHELKSPIAGMKLSLQTLQRPQLTDEQRGQLLNRCIQETDRLADLCNNMLLTSQIEGKQYKAARENISFSDLVENTSDICTVRYPGRIATDIHTGCTLHGDMLMLQMAINNLVENAIKYTPDGSPIEIRLHKGKKEITLQVADVGAGIPDSEKQKIFSKFYRIGDEGTRRTKGTGLGLYLTRKIVQQHGGKLTVRNNVPQGAIFQIWLPC